MRRGDGCTWRCSGHVGDRRIRPPAREVRRAKEPTRAAEQVGRPLGAQGLADDGEMRAIARYRALRAAWAPCWGNGTPRTHGAPGQAQP
jgi:hypothetical protein